MNVANVTFEPGCINFWHKHYGSCQVLAGVSGKGYYQIWGEEPKELLPGQSVTIPEGVKHWHGAQNGSWFQHLSISGDRLPAIAMAGPYGAVKEQVSGRYAQEMAARGFLTLAFDPSFTGESAGEPRNTTSPDISTEDFSAAVDYLANHENADADRIGILGICGWGGFALNATAMDTRIKATVTSTMYDMSRTTLPTDISTTARMRPPSKGSARQPANPSAHSGQQTTKTVLTKWPGAFLRK